MSQSRLVQHTAGARGSASGRSSLARGVAPGATMGLDVGDRYTYIHVLDAGGECLETGRLVTAPAAFERRFALAATGGPLRVVLEVGAHSPWASRLLAELGHEVVVANARRVRLIAENVSKCDPLDAETLARLGRLDPALLAPITHRGAAAQADLALVRARDALVRTRTLLVNHARGAVKALGGRLPACSTPSFPAQVREAVPEALRPALTPVLDVIAALTGRLRDYDQRVEALATTRYPETARLRQVAGVGALTALAYVLVLEDPTRFATSRAVGSYLGLRPRRDQSAGRAPELPITKAGDPLVRRLLVGSAHYVLGPFGPDTDLRRWGLALAARGGKNAKKRAVVAVARKLAVLLHRLWLTGATYEPLRASGLQTPKLPNPEVPTPMP
jgi:transposase